MTSIHRFLNKLRILAHRESFDRELQEEMAYHREQKIQEFQSRGMTPQSARHAVSREFGNDTSLKEQSRDVIDFWFETTLQDFRFSLRQLRKNLVFTSTAICVLALGTCASISIFAFVDAALIKPLPYQDPSRLVGVFERVALFEHSNLSLPDYLDWKKSNESFTLRGKNATAEKRTSWANPSPWTEIRTSSSECFPANSISSLPNPPSSGPRFTPPANVTYGAVATVSTVLPV